MYYGRRLIQLEKCTKKKVIFIDKKINISCIENFVGLSVGIYLVASHDHGGGGEAGLRH